MEIDSNGPKPEKIFNLNESTDELRKIIQTFSVTPMAVTIASLRFTDPAGVEVVLSMTLQRPSLTPEIDVVGSYDEDLKRAGGDYVVFKTEGIEALAKRVQARMEEAQADAEAEGEVERAIQSVKGN